MKTTYKPLIFPILLAAAALTVPIRPSAAATPEGEEPDAELAPSEFSKSANTWPKGDYVVIDPRSGGGMHLGPTGMWGMLLGQNIRVKRIDPGSPADGKVMLDDVIYGTKGNTFPAEREVIYYLATAITEAETKEAGGKLILDIRRDGKLIQVPIQLRVMGSYSSTTPWNCEKSEKIVAGAEEYMRKGLRPETGLPHNSEYMYGPWNDSVLFLLAAGNPELQGLVRRYILNTIKNLEDWKAGGVRGLNFGGWDFAYLKMLFGETPIPKGFPIG